MVNMVRVILPQHLLTLAGVRGEVALEVSGPVMALPTSELFGLTPQMLATYFQPLAGGTNGTMVTDPFHVSFIPPFALPDKSSHAEYIVK